jgi:hypothetical protein
MRGVRRYSEGSPVNALLNQSAMTSSFLEPTCSTTAIARCEQNYNMCSGLLSSSGCLGNFGKILDEGSERVWHGAVADVNRVNGISCNDCNYIFILVRPSSQIIDDRHLKESRFVEQVMQTSSLTGRHAVEVKVHRQFSPHHSPGPLKVDHCHFYLPSRFKAASQQRLADSEQLNSNVPPVGRVFVYEWSRGLQGSAEEIECCGFLVLNRTIDYSAAEISKIALSIDL